MSSASLLLAEDDDAMRKTIFKIRSSRSIDPQQLANSPKRLPELLVESLQHRGFTEVKLTGNAITFKPDMTDSDLESFQRRYGDGLLYFTEGDHPSIELVTNRTREKLQQLAIDLLVLLAANYYFYQSEHQLVYPIAANLLLVTITIYNLLNTRCSCRRRHRQLLHFIEEDLDNLQK